MCASLCPAGELQILGKTAFPAARGSATAGCRVPQMGVEELQGKWSVHLLRLPHFLNCRLIVQADHDLTGYRERMVTSKLVKESWVVDVFQITQHFLHYSLAYCVFLVSPLQI